MRSRGGRKQEEKGGVSGTHRGPRSGRRGREPAPGKRSGAVDLVWGPPPLFKLSCQGGKRSGGGGGEFGESGLGRIFLIVGNKG